MAQSPNPGQTPFVNWLTTTLPANGYTVTQGTYTTFPGCSVFITAFGSCFGNNTATPYLITQPPVASPDNLPSYATASDCLLTGTNPSGQTTSDLWQVAPDQAIVTVITLPPQGAYLGFQTYMMERSIGLYEGASADPVTEPKTCMGASKGGYIQAPDGNLVVFNDFANAVNNADIAAMVPAFNGSAWNTTSPISYNTIAIITTPNKKLAGDMISEFSGDKTEIFTETMPATIYPNDTDNSYLLYPCNGPINTPCDAFTSIIRYTLAQNYGVGQQWETAGTVLVYRVELPTVSTAPTALYDTQTVYNELNPQGCNTNETGAPNAPPGCAPATLASSSFDYDLQTIAKLLQAWGNIATGDTYGVDEFSGTGKISNNGGLATCIDVSSTDPNSGHDCGGSTEDTDFYRTYDAGTLAYYPSEPNKLRPVFVVGILHSDSPDDFSPNGTTVLTAPVNNADYTGISIADISSQFNNWGVADAANPNSASEYYVPPTQRVMLGSAYTVLTYLTQNTDGTGPTLYSLLPTSVQQDINNIYIHVFQRNDAAATGTSCTMQTCSNAIAEDVTTIINGTAPAAPQPATPPLPATIPESDSIRLTERAYLLAPTPNAPTLSENLTGAAVQYLQSPYIVCDITNTSCPASPN